MKTRLIPLLLGALALALLSACSGQGTAASPSVPEASPAVQTDTPSAAPAQTGLFGDFTAQDLEGNEVDQTIFSEHDLTMVNIWATFCGPCLREMPDLGEIHEEYADQGFQIVGIVMDVLNKDGSYNDQMVQTAVDYAASTGAGYTHLLPSTDLIVAKLQNVTGVPETIFVDKEGNQVGEPYLGAKTKEQWVTIIDALLEEVK